MNGLTLLPGPCCLVGGCGIIPNMKVKNLISRMIRAFVPAQVTEHKAVDAIDIARRYGHGNVCIQLGRIMTSEEYQAKRARVLAYDFQ